LQTPVYSPVLTIVLVSKGRDDYLKECLSSFEQFKNEPDVNFILINNGAGEYSSNLMRGFVQNDSSKRTLIFKPVNDPRPSAFWADLQMLDTGWVIFPSDDDILLPNAIKVWRNELEKSANLIAIGASANVINANSRETGVCLSPAILNKVDSATRLANCFYQPSFVWPALYINMKAFHPSLCNSRYAFDWWVGLNLLTNDNIVVLDVPVLRYRTHDLQESNVSSLRRKYFEATIWQLHFLSDEAFLNWVKTNSPENLLKFWSEVVKMTPIYGDFEFGAIVLLSLANSLSSNSLDRQVSGTISADIARVFGIVLKLNEGWHISREFEKLDWSGNQSVILDKNVCTEVQEACKNFPPGPVSESLNLGCAHSNSHNSSIKIDCTNFSSSNSILNADLISMAIMNSYEFSGKFKFSLSPGEVFLVKNYRQLYRFLPASLIMIAKRWKKS